MRIAVYARVSTLDKGQDPELQLKPLRDYCSARGWLLTEEMVDHCTGKRDSRPQLDLLMTKARKRLIDVVLVWKLDRFGRSLKHLVTTIDELSALGVAFISYQEQIDLSTPTGKLMFHIIAAMAEFERSLIAERVKAGVANAKAKGKRIGRKAIPPVDRKKIIDVHIENPELSVRVLADKVKMKPGTVHKTLSLFKAEKIDRDGFECEVSLCT